MTRYLVCVDDAVGFRSVHDGMIDDLEEALALTAKHDNCCIIGFEPNESNCILVGIQLRLTPAEQESYNWLLNQGGLVEMAAAGEYATNWWHLERKHWIRRVVPEECSRIYWSTCLED